MSRILLIVIALICTISVTSSGHPYCVARTYDERDGLSHHTVNKVLQDKNGMIWIASWNGLCRWDGYEFSTIHPPHGSPVRKYSSGFNDIKTDGDGRILWCFIDDSVILFDVDTYQYHDLQSDIEKRLGETVKVRHIFNTQSDDIALWLTDGRCLYFSKSAISDGLDPLGAMEVRPDMDGVEFRQSADRELGDVASFTHQQLTFSRKDAEGGKWLITRDGRVLYSPSDSNQPAVMAEFDVPDTSLRYCCDDDQGNIWLRSRYGLHKLTIGLTSYSKIESARPSRLRASMIDSDGRIWLSWSDAGFLTVMDSINGPMRYLASDGRLSDVPVKFGPMIYGITQASDSQIWLASKEKCIFRLTRSGSDGFMVERFSDDPSDPSAPTGKQYYDMTVDGRGRLWISSMKNGIYVVENPEAKIPVFKSLVALGGYPEKANRVRSITIVGDTLALAVTTGGLLSFNIPDEVEKERLSYSLHISDPDRPNSLGSIATLDMEVGDDGSVYVATSGDGINRLISPLSVSRADEWDFESLRQSYKRIPDVVQAIAKLSDGRIMIVGNKEICVIDPAEKGKTTVIGQSYWHDNIDFKEVKPLALPDGRWLIGADDGVIVSRIGDEEVMQEHFPIEFVGVSIEGKESTPLSPGIDSIVLGKTERAMSLTFAALCYTEPKSVRYAYRMSKDEDWKLLGAARTLTFNHLEPGDYSVSVRSTDTHGHWLDNEKNIQITVTPTFWETGLAKILYVLIAVLVIGAIVAAIVYMRRMRRQQRLTLEAYLKLLDAPGEGGEDKAAGIQEAEVAAEIETRVSPDDRIIISNVIEFIEQNFFNPDISVGDMAAAASISRSGLTRKMKSLMGVTPADFLRTTRLKRAAVLLRDTNDPIKDIAIDCGFSDMNYFGKCFKSVYGVTPGKYRKG